jgi:peptidoglycan lytic transglycosylase
VKIPKTTYARVVLMLTGVVLCAVAASPALAVSRRLRRLAAGAEKRESWEALRRFGESARNSEERSLALFTLGYREYEAGEYDSALGDLRRAAGNDFSLLDYAQYFRAASARQAGEAGEVTEALEGFSTRYPRSTSRLDALELLASVLLEQGQAGRAVEILTAEPRVRQRPDLALLLARAYEAAGRPVAAAGAYQDVYYAFPAASEAETAGSELAQLQASLGRNFPQAPIEIQTARAQILYRGRNSADALKEYEHLLRTYPQSPHAGRWEVGRARALIALRRTTQAAEVLKKKLAGDPENDAWRLATLVECHRRLEDEDGVIRTTGEIAKAYPESPAYAAALHEAGNYFVREGEWTKAAVYYQKLVESFPRSEFAPEANWRVAWAFYREGNQPKAAESMLGHLRRYPDSSQVPAVLYWLGRLAEKRGDWGEARFLYELLDRRFGVNFYAGQAAERLKLTPLRKALEIAAKDSPVATLASEIPPPPSPELSLCPPPRQSELLERFTVLEDLALDDLAEQYLRRQLREDPGHPEAAMALARSLAKQGRVDVALFEAQKAAPNYPNYDFSVLPRQAWELLYPRSYRTLVARYARSQGLDANLVMGLVRQESAFNPRATSSSDARGLMQVLPRTVSRRGSRRRVAARRLYEPSYNLRIGCAYLKARLKSFDGKVEQALASYHAGPTRVKRWIEGQDFSEPTEFLESIPIPATRGYVERVLRDAVIYRQLMAGTAKFANCPAAPAPQGGD